MLRGLYISSALLLGSCAYITDKEHQTKLDDLVEAGLADSQGFFTVFGDEVIDSNPATSVPLSTHSQVAVSLSDALLAAGLEDSAGSFEIVACPGTFDPAQGSNGCIFVEAEQANNIFVFDDNYEIVADCTTQGAHLLTIDTLAENRFIGSNMDFINFGNDWWTGYNDTNAEGTFDWEDGTPFTLTQWAGSEPSSETIGTDCVVIQTGAQDWDVRDCGLSQFYICEID